MLITNKRVYKSSKKIISFQPCPWEENGQASEEPGNKMPRQSILQFSTTHGQRGGWGASNYTYTLWINSTYCTKDIIVNEEQP